MQNIFVYFYNYNIEEKVNDEQKNMAYQNGTRWALLLISNLLFSKGTKFRFFLRFLIFFFFLKFADFFKIILEIGPLFLNPFVRISTQFPSFLANIWTHS